jgi:hypothetical protein
MATNVNKMNENIQYLRKKTIHRDRIVWDYATQSFKNRHITIVKGFDHILNRWNKISEKTELLPVESYPTHPSKKLEFSVVLQRQATDYQTLKTLIAHFKQKIRVSVKDTESNIYLVLVNGKIFMCDIYRGTTAPMQMNYTPQNIKREAVSEPERITEQEKNMLLNQGYPLYEEILMPNGNSEFKQMV